MHVHGNSRARAEATGPEDAGRAQLKIGSAVPLTGVEASSDAHRSSSDRCGLTLTTSSALQETGPRAKSANSGQLSMETEGR